MDSSPKRAPRVKSNPMQHDPATGRLLPKLSDDEREAVIGFATIMPLARIYDRPQGFTSGRALPVVSTPSQRGLTDD